MITSNSLNQMFTQIWTYISNSDTGELIKHVLQVNLTEPVTAGMLDTTGMKVVSSQKSGNGEFPRKCGFSSHRINIVRESLKKSGS